MKKTAKKYEIVADAINKEIESDLNVEKLPSEILLMQKYEVSRDTIRAALNKLKREDIIYSRRGSGYYVKKKIPHITNLLNMDFTVTEMAENAGIEIDKESEMIMRIYSDKYIKYFGECRDFFVIERTRTAMKHALDFSRIILPVNIVGADFPMRYRKGSLKTFLNKELSMQTVETYARIEAYEKKKDNIPQVFDELPIIKLTQDNRLKRGETLLLTEDFVRSDVIELYVHRKPKQ